MDAQERDRLTRLEAQMKGVVASMDRLRDELTKYVLQERYIWTERIVIGIVSGFVGFGVSSLVAA
tara:strand:- start:150 stop:344 length:195 start_codon:yes stop_codon:yes gene_type:complete